MRASCTYCARKHLAQALILLQESEQGYPEHFWLALGHLAEASDELIWDFPVLANNIREQRKALETAHKGGTRMRLDLMDFIRRVGEAGESEEFSVVLKPTKFPPPNVPYDPEDYPDVKPSLQGMRATLAAADSPGSFFTLPPHQRDELMRGIADAEKAEESSTTTASPVVAPAKPCGGCGQEKKRKELHAKWAQENTEKPRTRLVIVATLSNFDPSYSLVSVVFDQVRAASMLPDTTVHLWVHVNAALDKLPPLPGNVEVTACIPVVGAGDDIMLETTSQMLASIFRTWLDAVGPCTVITHDLVFQAGLLNFARAMHMLAADRSPNAHFYHMVHSSVGKRPTTEKAQWRAMVPLGHKMVAVNVADLPYLQAYYQAPPDQFISLPNPRDVRTFLGMLAPNPSDIITAHSLHLATYLQVYPLSATRMSPKGVPKVIGVFRELLRLEGDDPAAVRLVIADAHANGKEGKDQKTLMKRYAADVGLPEECLVFASDMRSPEDTDGQSKGLDAQTIRILMQLANVFIFPTISEAGSLVLMEAALAGNLLVLNSSLPCLRDYIDAQDAIWVPFGSVKEPGTAINNAEVAAQIEGELARSKSQRAKRAIAQKHCSEAYALLLKERLTWWHPAASAAGKEPAPV